MENQKTSPDLDRASVRGASGLKNLVGNCSMDLFSIGMGRYILTDTEDQHIPCGPEPAGCRPDSSVPAGSPWNGLYSSKTSMNP